MPKCLGDNLQWCSSKLLCHVSIKMEIWADAMPTAQDVHHQQLAMRLLHVY